MKLREKIKGQIFYEIDNGDKNFVWHDNWHLFGLLVKKFCSRIIHDSKLDKYDKVKEVIMHKEWH